MSEEIKLTAIQKRHVSSNSSVGRFHWSSTPVGSDRRLSSTWAALATPAFRKLWIAGVVSGTCVAAHDTAAMWMMNMLTPSPFLISLLSTVASLPFFLFILPAGALADMVDRKKLLCLVNVWLAGTAAGLAILGWLNLLIWGSAVTAVGTTYLLLGAAVLFLISLALAGRLSINFTGTLNLDPAPVAPFSHKLIYTPHPHGRPHIDHRRV